MIVAGFICNSKFWKQLKYTTLLWDIDSGVGCECVEDRGI